MDLEVSDQNLRAVIKSIFDKYDADRSGTLEAQEVKEIINDALNSRNTSGTKKSVTDKDVDQFLKQADQNGDGKVTQE
jgi:Ca2+-binding EF-hand superfamily protein